MLGSQSIAPKARRRRRDGGTSPSLEVTRLGDEDAEADGIGMNGHAGPSKKNVDDLLPVGVSFEALIEPIPSIIPRSRLL